MTEIILEKEINVKEKIEEVVKERSKYKVIFMNDNETPMDFVVAIFNRNIQTFRKNCPRINHENT